MTISATAKGMSNKGDRNDPIELTSEGEELVFDFTKEPDVMFAQPSEIKRPKQLIETPTKRQKANPVISPEPKMPTFNDNPVDTPVPRDYILTQLHICFPCLSTFTSAFTHALTPATTIISTAYSLLLLSLNSR